MCYVWNIVALISSNRGPFPIYNPKKSCDQSNIHEIWKISGKLIQRLHIFPQKLGMCKLFKTSCERKKKYFTIYCILKDQRQKKKNSPKKCFVSEPSEIKDKFTTRTHHYTLEELPHTRICTDSGGKSTILKIFDKFFFLQTSCLTQSHLSNPTQVKP